MTLITKDDDNRIRASEVPYFGTQKRPFSAILGAKVVLQMPETKYGDRFLSQITPKSGFMLFHVNITFGRVFGKF